MLGFSFLFLIICQKGTKNVIKILARSQINIKEHFVVIKWTIQPFLLLPCLPAYMRNTKEKSFNFSFLLPTYTQEHTLLQANVYVYFTQYCRLMTETNNMKGRMLWKYHTMWSSNEVDKRIWSRKITFIWFVILFFFLFFLDKIPFFVYLYHSRKMTNILCDLSFSFFLCNKEYIALSLSWINK